MDERTGTRIIEGPSGSELVLPKLSLNVVDGPSAGKTLVLDRLMVRIGTSADNDLVISDDAVSTHHCELEATAHGWRIRDVQSTNGTTVQGVRVIEAFVGEHATIGIGETQLVLTSSGDGQETRFPLSRRTSFGRLLGHSHAMRSVFTMLEQAAKTDSTVLLLGESGTGKEVAARALHEKGRRCEMPYVVFDCGAASATLVESQLFGHDKGAYTGATEARAGVFEAASGGTLVLDEIGELPLELQPKFLRVLETRTVRRLGETKDRPVDVRLVACTHRNLEEEIEAGRFRQDLFFRLSVITIRLPPLRERREEIPRLVRHFLGELQPDDAPEIGSEMLAVLNQHRWPGNVRELRNFVERLIALPGFDPAALLGVAEDEAQESVSVSLKRPFHDAKQQWTERFEKAYLEALLATHGDNISQAARVSGLSRQTCYRLMRKYGLEVD